MHKLIALVAAGLFAAGTVMAGQHGDCMKQVSNHEMTCEVSLTNLNLTPAQKTKLEAVRAEHQKEGCTKASEAKYMHEVKGILTKSQYAKFKSECANCAKDKSQA